MQSMLSMMLGTDAAKVAPQAQELLHFRSQGRNRRLQTMESSSSVSISSTNSAKGYDARRKAARSSRWHRLGRGKPRGDSDLLRANRLSEHLERPARPGGSQCQSTNDCEVQSGWHSGAVAVGWQIRNMYWW
jgi:hypothetical protein